MSSISPEDVADRLEGTCDSLDYILEEEDFDPPITWLHRLDGLVFCCNSCNWWFRTSEMSEVEDWTCIECESP